jgi:hypothetical protein
MSLPTPDPLSGGGSTSHFWPTLAGALRSLFRRDDDPLELIARERAALGDRYWPDAKPAVEGDDFLQSTAEMTEAELRWRIRVRRIRDVLGLIAIAAITVLLAVSAWHAVATLG